MGGAIVTSSLKNRFEATGDNRPTHLEVVLKMHLTLNGCVAICFKMLTYWRVRSAFKTDRRLALERYLLFKDSFYHLHKFKVF